MSNKETKLAGKLVKILEELSSVPKKGFNQHQNYYYMREVDVLEALKKELIVNKVILLTSSKLVDIRPKEKTDKNGNKQVEFITTVETTHTFVDSETGEQLSVNSVGSGYDSTDKGAAKAITSATKYALLKTFMISDEGADIENDGETKHDLTAKLTTNTPSTTKTFGTPQNSAPKKSFGFTKATVDTSKVTLNSPGETTIQVTQSSSGGVVTNSETKVVDTTTPVTNSVPFTTPATISEEKPRFARRTQQTA